MIGILDYGMGNLLSVYHAVEMVGADPEICTTPEMLKSVDKLILPGVGAFGDCMANLHQKGFVDALTDAVIHQSKPILGICLGMQVMATRGFEGGDHNGLGWFEADVVRLRPNNTQFRVPHVGWNEVTYRPDHPLFSNLPQNPDLYFVHSYYMQCAKESDVIGTSDHGGTITAAISKDHIFATQFHPEKSQDQGLSILKNFVDWTP